jgi:hypothetical protein
MNTNYAPYTPRSRASSGSSARSGPVNNVNSPVEDLTSARSPARNHFPPSTQFTSTIGNVPLSEEPEDVSTPTAELRLAPLPQPPPGLSDPEKRRWELQVRVYRARATMPKQVALRIFRDPSECVEAGYILDQLNIGTAESG